MSTSPDATPTSSTGSSTTGSGTTGSSTTGTGTTDTTTRYDDTTGTGTPWKTGLLVFAGTIMIVGGIFQFLAGLVALFRNEVYVVGLNYVYSFDVTTWGWIHLIIGIVVALAGAAVLTGKVWGRVVGVGLAVISMLSNFMFIPYYPLWSLLIIALDVFVIWALCSAPRDAVAV
ncbi:hypothetical protein GCM10010464_51170 [Pseudonocardia yunnanensis]|uniref:DUF7144 domain-containing protein n=1 Tax=Pseudonocardia yunnanensis TaxID=58107 RepID=A0ABW4ELF5_9PSEU